jgi:hypothetical protein
MNKKLKTPNSRDFNLESFGDLVSGKLSIVGEDAGTFEAFRSGLLKSLTPMTPYECVVAENLIAIEWELLQQRRMREASIRSALLQSLEYAVRASWKAEYEASLDRLWVDHVSQGGSQDDFEITEAFDAEGAIDAAKDLFARATSKDPTQREDAHTEITELGSDPLDLMARGYRGNSNNAELHDQKVQNLERRRREVKRDLDDLQRARPLELDPDPE